MPWPFPSTKHSRLEEIFSQEKLLKGAAEIDKTRVAVSPDYMIGQSNFIHNRTHNNPTVYRPAHVDYDKYWAAIDMEQRDLNIAISKGRNK